MRVQNLCLALLLLAGTSSSASALPFLRTYIAGGYLQVQATNTETQSYSCVVNATYTAYSDKRGTVLDFQVPANVSSRTVASFGPMVDAQLTSASTSCVQNPA